MAKPRVSVLIVAKNEAHNLADCLAAAGWAFERIVVVDPVSRDATLEIAWREAEVVAVRDFDDFASQRNFGLALARGEWVLSVDADERVTPALAAEIDRVMADAANPYHGFRIPIRSVILGRPFG
ncbi:MAG TPA: glycosyltransferase family 2 protein, partial [Pirellulales bacterium]